MVDGFNSTESMGALDKLEKQLEKFDHCSKKRQKLIQLLQSARTTVDKKIIQRHLNSLDDKMETIGKEVQDALNRI